MKLKALDFTLVAIQFALFALYLFPYDLNGGIDLPEFSIWPVWIVFGIGLIEIVWAIYQLRNFISPFPKPRAKTELITHGAFSIARHPIYSGIILISLAYGIYSQDVFRMIMALFFLIFFYLKSSYEEQNMMRVFPSYAAYKKRTGRFFPFRLPSTKP